MKRTLIGGLFAAATLFGGLALTSPTPVSAAQEVCPDLGTGKISSTELSVTITADPGFLISEYCVKAGSDQSVDDGAVVRVVLDPAMASVTFSGPDGKAISHYSYSQVKIPEETTTTTTATTVPGGMVTPPTPIEGQVASNSPVGPQAAGPAAPAAGGVIAAAPTQLPSTGTSSWVMALTALAALAGGTGLMRLSRRQTS